MFLKELRDSLFLIATESVDEVLHSMSACSHFNFFFEKDYSIKTTYLHILEEHPLLLFLCFINYISRSGKNMKDLG